MSDSRVEDEAAVNAVLSDAYKGWEANDAEAFVSHYTEDATAILPGSFRGSREVIRASMAKSFEGPLKGSSTYNKQLSMRFLGQDGAIVVSESGILFAGESEVPEARKVYATWVLEKRDGDWHIAAYHNCPMLAAAH
ncbi:SgcJ/EcaC family oxidoreductase [Streptomyces brevispora]|uniref:SgcJ/EcaC family oxidoreductase n=1 Tax=Streptomyces brevispora TaxID=887462 RepID=UPI002E30F2A6|nr:SgcJ/EcaC family oxidoreductase [Streptomyces brevispora]